MTKSGNKTQLVLFLTIVWNIIEGILGDMKIDNKTGKKNNKTNYNRTFSQKLLNQERNLV